MSIANHFDRRRDAGFVRSYDLRAARRQFQVSLILILVLAGAAIALGLVMRLDQPVLWSSRSLAGGRSCQRRNVTGQMTKMSSNCHTNFPQAPGKLAKGRALFSKSAAHFYVGARSLIP